MRKLNGSQKRFYAQFARHGQGDTLVEISPQEVALLTAITHLDLHKNDVPEWLSQDLYLVSQKPFFEIGPNEISQLNIRTPEMAYDILMEAGIGNLDSPDYLYLTNLSALYRRRTKYLRILRQQQFPSADQIGPRCLLEYGNTDSSLLFSWMMWRKLTFDLDNRSAQETGYLFEPIVASCLGGVQMGSKNSVVHRLDAHGVPTNDGRQIDCYVEDTQKVYELKMRMTIAASGQGRFAEELSFPMEAQAAGLTPVLIVFDPTPSNRLTELQKAYANAGGESATGDDAWDLLKNNAEVGMATFIEKYVEPPINAAKTAIYGIPESVTLEATEHCMTIAGNEKTYTILREHP
ncbi:MAG: hypothetical protein IKS49_01740 [Actinomycetaceae bacterium]|nr:hypothetical protein [Actinomycetaceae bacterium]